MDGWKDGQHYHLYAPKRSVILFILYIFVQMQQRKVEVAVSVGSY